MKEFRSKIDYTLLSLIVIVLGICVASTILGDAPVKAVLVVSIICVVTLVFILHLFFSTTYRVHQAEGALHIKCGYFFNVEVDIMTIKSIRKTRNPLASPAPSLDRLEVRYGKFDSVIISPKDKAGLVYELTKINPRIEHRL